MSLRAFLERLEERDLLVRVKELVDPRYEVAEKSLEAEGKALLFEELKGFPGFRLLTNLCSSRTLVASFLGVSEGRLKEVLLEAYEKPTQPKVVEGGPCQEVVLEGEDASLWKLPIPIFTRWDPGPYITGGVFVAHDEEFGYNLSFHRACPIGRNELVARVCERDLYKYLKRKQRRKQRLEVAICIGLEPSILLAASTSLGIEVDEYTIANSLSEVELVKCVTNDLLVPAQAELVIEGEFTERKEVEGPFLDVTGTLDRRRLQPVVEVKCITHRKDPIFHAIVPASKEHKLLMGLPREAAILRAVSRVCECLDVVLTEGGCNWLHAVVRIRKRREVDAKRAVEEAFKAHPSLKHVVVVDEDINPYDLLQVEWALATRFQAGKDVFIRREKGSSLDLSATSKGLTYKVGIDATKPLRGAERFERLR